jgi:23S rRNA (uracil1939-C5)-methyltransferase
VSVRKGERLEGRVRDVVQSGDAVVETSRGLVFARGALTGERVLVSLDGKPGRLLRGRLVSVLEPVAERVASPCAHALRCGGCPLMHASSHAQHALKQRFLRDALVKAGAPADLQVAFHASPSALHYRRRARLAFRVAGKARELGYRRERSHEIIDVSDCVVLEPGIERARLALRDVLLPALVGSGEVSLALGARGGAVAVLHCPEPQPSTAYAACQALVRDGALEGISLYAAGATAPARFGEVVEWSEAVDGAPLEGTEGGFSQAQDSINRLLVARVTELAHTAGARVLELFAGHGNFTVLLAREAESYTAVEQDAAAVAALRRNLSARSLKAKVVEGDAARHVGTGALDVLVLDPPRAGAPGVLAQAAQRKPRRIVYVSCDPATLGRDVGEALAAGYRIEVAEAFDMFPNTADLESVVLLTR